MKSIIIFLTLAISLPALAQHSPSDRLFEKMASQKGITSLSFSREMIDAVNLDFDNEDGSESRITGDLKQMKLLIYNAPEDAETIDFREETLRLLPLSRFSKIDPESCNMDKQDGSLDIRVQRKGRRIKECHILFQNETNGVLLSFFGDFKIEDVEGLARQVNEYK